MHDASARPTAHQQQHSSQRNPTPTTPLSPITNNTVHSPAPTNSSRTPIRPSAVLSNSTNTTTPAAVSRKPPKPSKNVSRSRERENIKRPKLEEREQTGSWGSEVCECGENVAFDSMGRSTLTRHRKSGSHHNLLPTTSTTPAPLLPRVPSIPAANQHPFTFPSVDSTPVRSSSSTVPQLLPPLPVQSPSAAAPAPHVLSNDVLHAILCDPNLRLQLLNSLTRCPGYLVTRCSEKPAGVLFAPHLLSQAGLPWARASMVGEELYLESQNCAGLVTVMEGGVAQPCQACSMLKEQAKVVALRNNAMRVSQIGVNRQYMSFSQLERVYEAVVKDASTLRKKLGKRESRIKSLLIHQQLHRDLLLLMESSDYPRIPALLRRAARRNESPAKIIATLQLILDGSLRLRSFSEKEEILAMFHNHLGGEKGGQIAFKAHHLQSPRQVRRQWGKRHLRHSTGYATASDIRHNLDVSFGYFGGSADGEASNDEQWEDENESSGVGAEKTPASVEYPKGRVWTWMTDGVHVGGTAVWDSATNRLEGPSRESRGTKSADLGTYEDLLKTYESLKDGSLVFATEVAVSALAPYSITDYHPRIISASPTNPAYLAPATDPVARLAERRLRDSNLAADVEQQVRICDEFFEEHGMGVLVSLSADAAADVRRAITTVVTSSTLSIEAPAVAKLLEGARRICQQCGPRGKKLSSDDRHGWKTFGSTKRRALGINVFGVVLTPAVQVAQFHRAFPELSSFQISLLFWSGRGNMDVPAVTDLMRKEGQAVLRRRDKISSDPDDFRSPIQERTDAASDLMGHISTFLLDPYYATSSATTLSTLLIGLSTAQHLLFYCYRAKSSAFIPGTVYISLCSSIDATFTAVAQAIALGDPTYQFPINRSGSQGLESVFGHERTQHGSRRDFDILELTGRFSHSADLEEGYSKCPDLRLPRDRRNLSGSVDLVSPRDTPDVDLCVSNLTGTLGELYSEGERQAIKIIVDLRLATLAELESAPAHFDCLSPFGVQLGSSEAPLEGADDGEDPSNQPFDDLSQRPAPSTPHRFPTVDEATQILQTHPSPPRNDEQPSATPPDCSTSLPQQLERPPLTSSSFNFAQNSARILELEAHLLQTSLGVAERHLPESPSRPNRFFPPCAVGPSVHKARGVKTFLNEGHERQSQDRQTRTQQANRYQARKISEGGTARAFDRDSEIMVDAALEADHLIAFLCWTGSSAALAIARVVDIQLKKGEFEPQATQEQLDAPDTSIRYQLLTLYPGPNLPPNTSSFNLQHPLYWEWSLSYESFGRVDNKFLVEARLVVPFGDGREFFVSNEGLTTATYRFPEQRLHDFLQNATTRLGSHLSSLPKLPGSPTFPYRNSDGEEVFISSSVSEQLNATMGNNSATIRCLVPNCAAEVTPASQQLHNSAHLISGTIASYPSLLPHLQTLDKAIKAEDIPLPVPVLASISHSTNSSITHTPHPPHAFACGFCLQHSTCPATLSQAGRSSTATVTVTSSCRSKPSTYSFSRSKTAYKSNPSTNVLVACPRCNGEFWRYNLRAHFLDAHLHDGEPTAEEGETIFVPLEEWASVLVEEGKLMRSRRRENETH
ncbi:hypothetical protein P7C70_g4501, partial [Phenoliferia sp. Uapishka_3]